ncbi:hypothetical protein F0562_021129 [Nyssa sinensis]|uniref:Uncharacterized protein n=1 Tax=Nyssa sinensis TaxID=561372 RepID=A0A5J5BL47_9ASTE|nr:hypothetical protein F0562_021129 [Nyssa sinensis]
MHLVGISFLKLILFGGHLKPTVLVDGRHYSLPIFSSIAQTKKLTQTPRTQKKLHSLYRQSHQLIQSYNLPQSSSAAG